LAMGGNVRVGLEDSLWGGPGRLAQSNAEQVTLARKMIEGLGMEVATPDEARAILGLKGADKVAFLATLTTPPAAAARPWPGLGRGRPAHRAWRAAAGPVHNRPADRQIPWPG